MFTGEREMSAISGFCHQAIEVVVFITGGAAKGVGLNGAITVFAVLAVGRGTGVVGSGSRLDDCHEPSEGVVFVVGGAAFLR